MKKILILLMIFALMTSITTKAQSNSDQRHHYKKEQKKQLPRAKMTAVEQIGSNDVSDKGSEDRSVTKAYKEEASFDGNAEEPKEKKEEVFLSVEQMPQFPGEEIGLFKYLQSHLEYSPEEVGVENERVIVQVLVDKTGKVTKAKLVRKSLNQRLNDEALRVCGSLPDFTPGRQNGVAVSVWYTIPVTFKGTGGL